MLAAGVVWMLAAPTDARGQAAPPLATALQLYAAASYEEALSALDAARRPDLPVDDLVVLDQHRMLCLLALGRGAAAADAAIELLQRRPQFTLGTREASPRVRAMFDQARRRVLPGVVRRLYGEARGAYDGGDYAAAHDGFTRVTELLADPFVLAAEPALEELRVLADGFQQLSGAALDRRSSRRDELTVQAALAALHPLEPVAPAEAHAAAAPPFAPLGIFTYDWRDKTVTPPVALEQTVSGWWGAMGEPPLGTSLGALEVVVDVNGRVVDARVARSVNRVYDGVLLASAKQWRYRPATKDGHPVAYRRVTAVVSGR